jgi:fused signal recognition particle receptor
MDLSPQLLIGGAAAVVTALSVLLLTLTRGGGAEPGEGKTPAPLRDAAESSQNLWGAFRAGLAKTRQGLGTRLKAAIRGDATQEARFAGMEEALILADVGMPTTQKLLGRLRGRAGLESPEALLAALKEEVKALLTADSPALESAERPLVIVVAGVNGVGKTTSIAKLAHLYRGQGRRVLIGAADTFRAAAIEQLEVWAERVGCDFVKHQHGADPSAVAFDAVKAARGRGADIAIVDTAGRLHVKANLMEELKKIVRVIGREMPGAPHEVLLVIDATTGQNALSQARQFLGALPLTGVILTKLDGTAKGGAVLAVRAELGVPVRYVGLGEQLDDLRPFDPEAFTEALFEA